IDDLKYAVAYALVHTDCLPRTRDPLVGAAGRQLGEEIGRLRTLGLRRRRRLDALLSRLRFRDAGAGAHDVVGLVVGPGGDVRVGQVEGEGAALTGLAPHVDLAAEEAGDLARNGEPEPGSAVLAARGPVGLLERLEDDLLLVPRDPDSGVDHREPQ